MRSSKLLAFAAFPLAIASCATEHEDENEKAHERVAKAESALEGEGHQFRFGFPGEGDGPRNGITSLPPDRETATVFAWCEGADRGPTFLLDNVEVGLLPCSEEGEVNEIVNDYAYSGGQLELRTEGSSSGAQWAFAVGVPPKEDVP